MPTYVYQVIDDAHPSGGGEFFEVDQRMIDAPLTAHPETGAPVRRVPQAPNIGGEHTDIREKSKLSDKNLERLGFTKYVNAGGGKFDKVVGGGPGALDRGD